ncbi:MAG: septum formation initiator family protein [Desulfobacterales bacterium]
MSRKHALALSGAVFLILLVGFYILFSERGVADLQRMLADRAQLEELNQKIVRENIALGQEIDRLNHDPAYIERIARKELGMIRPNEIVIKPQRPVEPIGK